MGHNKIGDTVKQFSLKTVDIHDELIIITYYFLSIPDNCRGLALDKIVETNNARNNRRFEALVTNARVCRVRK